MIDRRALLAALPALLFARPARAQTACRVDWRWGHVCASDVPFRAFQPAYHPQMASEWCWAACISMVFTYYGYPVAQPRIVREAYGTVANIPAANGLMIARALDRVWTSDNGRRFRSVLGPVFDAAAGVDTLNLRAIIAALSANHPLILGARGHAVVLTGVAYTPTQAGPRILSGEVFDPWPGIGVRRMRSDEFVPVTSGGTLSFIALPSVQPA